MEDFQFALLPSRDPLEAWLLCLGGCAALALLVLLACAWGIARRRRIVELFGLQHARARAWLEACARRRWLRAAILVVAASFLLCAALQPRSNPVKTRFKRNARDVAILVDVSRSMLAADLQPSRLERAKLEIIRLADSGALAGDRVGLIGFAGDAVILCPLTPNTSYFKSVVRNLSPRSAAQGGTRIGDAVRKALGDLLGLEEAVPPEPEGGPQPGETVIESELKSEKKSFADLLIVTDGEDHESYPKQAAQRAAALDVGIYVVGLGSEQGTPILVAKEGGTREPLRYKGEIVRSRLDSETLMEMVTTAPRGAYLPAGTDNFDLVDFYRTHLAAAEGREVVEESLSWTEVFQPFLLAGLALYLLYLLLPERPPRARSADLLEVPA